MLLESEFSAEKVREVVFFTCGDKALRPDGFPIAFFQHFWNLFKDELLQFFQEFHENGRISGVVGAAFIALIPKKKGAISMKDFHPISLIGSLYNSQGFG